MRKKPVANNPESPVKLRDALAKEQKARVDACTAELNALLEKYECYIDSALLFRQNGPSQFIIEIKAKG